jgi:hypothetical protein
LYDKFGIFTCHYSTSILDVPTSSHFGCVSGPSRCFHVVQIVAVLDSTPDNLVIESIDGNYQAQWTRKLQTVGLMDLEANTSSLHIINAWRAGSFGGFEVHDQKETFLDHNFAESGSGASGKTVTSGTKGALVHGALMILAWGFLSPAATIWMKYGKHLPAAIWFKGHMFAQVTAIVVTIVGIIVIFSTKVKFSDLTEDRQTHGRCGIIVLVLAIFQGLLGALRKVIAGPPIESDEDQPHGPRRWIFNLFHRTNGWALFVLSLFTVNLGIGLFHDEMKIVPKSWLQDPAVNLFQAYIFIAVGFVVLLEIFHYFTYQDATSYISTFGPLNCSGSKAVGTNFTANADWEMKVRSVAIAIFTALSISTTIALWVIIGDTDAEEWGK